MKDLLPVKSQSQRLCLILMPMDPITLWPITKKTKGQGTTDTCPELAELFAKCFLGE